MNNNNRIKTLFSNEELTEGEILNILEEEKGSKKLTPSERSKTSLSIFNASNAKEKADAAWEKGKNSLIFLGRQMLVVALALGGSIGTSYVAGHTTHYISGKASALLPSSKKGGVNTITINKKSPDAKTVTQKALKLGGDLLNLVKNKTKDVGTYIANTEVAKKTWEYLRLLLALMAALATFKSTIKPMYEFFDESFWGGIKGKYKDRAKKLLKEFDEITNEIDNVYSEVMSYANTGNIRGILELRGKLIALSEKINQLDGTIDEIREAFPKFSENLAHVNKLLDENFNLIKRMKGLLDQAESPNSEELKEIYQPSSSDSFTEKDQNSTDEEIPKVSTKSNAGIEIDLEDF